MLTWTANSTNSMFSQSVSITVEDDHTQKWVNHFATSFDCSVCCVDLYGKFWLVKCGATYQHWAPTSSFLETRRSNYNISHKPQIRIIPPSKYSLARHWKEVFAIVKQCWDLVEKWKHKWKHSVPPQHANSQTTSKPTTFLSWGGQPSMWEQWC